MRRLLLGSCAVVLGLITLASSESHAEGLRATRGKEIVRIASDKVSTNGVFDGQYAGDVYPTTLSQRGIRCTPHTTNPLNVVVRQLKRNRVEGFIALQSGTSRGTGTITRGGIKLKFSHTFQGYRRVTTIKLSNVTLGSAYAKNTQKLSTRGASCTWNWEGAVSRF